MNDMTFNFALNTLTNLPVILTLDSYKLSHFSQYPEGAEFVVSYIEPRGGIFDEALFFGLQAFIKQYLLTPITAAQVEEAAELYNAHGVPFNKDGWMKIVTDHKGFMPVYIQALPEGMVTGTRVPQVQVVNTDPALPWVTSVLETALLRAIWYPSTVASLSFKAKRLIKAGLELTSEDPEGEMPFKLHDFGARGATSSEAAMLGGMGHLVNFMGTDTVEAVWGAKRFYDCPMAGFSIPATEHSTMTSWERDGEIAAYENLLDKNPEGLVACVSDSYDIMNAVGNIWGGVLKDKVMARNGTLVIRPDSGDPTTMPLDVIELAMEKFGFTVNAKGFKVLPPQVRVIQGDGMNIETIKQLIANAIERKISVSNFAMGMGGGLLQKIDRDTMKYAMKACAAQVNGKWRDVYKDPITDQGKRSKRGTQAVIMKDGVATAIRLGDLPQGAHGVAQNLLRPVYENGRLLIDEDFEVIRARAASYL